LTCEPQKAYSSTPSSLSPCRIPFHLKKRREGTSSTGSHILDFEELKTNAEASRLERAAQQQERRDKRALKVEADKVRPRANDEVAKIRAQNIGAANDAVNILLIGGLDEHIKVRKGKTRDRHNRQFLDANLTAPCTPSPGGGDLAPPEEPDDSKKDADTSSQEQIAKLKF
jgi:hypothetical protein